MNADREHYSPGESDPTALSARLTPSPPLVCLTEREMAIARGVMRGASNKEIAAELGISPHTVRDHVSRLLAKFDVPSRTRLAVVLSSIASAGDGRLR